MVGKTPIPVTFPHIRDRITPPNLMITYSATSLKAISKNLRGLDLNEPEVLAPKSAIPGLQIGWLTLVHTDVIDMDELENDAGLWQQLRAHVPLLVAQERRPLPAPDVAESDRVTRVVACTMLD